MEESNQIIGAAISIFLIIGGSVGATALWVTYVEPWREKLRWRIKLRRAHIITTTKMVSRAEFLDSRPVRHWFNDEVAIWCVQNLSGKFGCVPIFDDDFIEAYLLLRFGEGERSFYFERFEDAVAFKMRWC